MTFQKALDRIVKLALEEDLGKGDVTSHALVPVRLRASARIVAKQSGIVAGLPVAQAVFRRFDPRLAVKVRYAEGRAVAKGARVAEITGPVRSILAAERTALNFAGHLSGIATLTHAFVERVKGTRAKILATRKTMPGLRFLEKAAVRSGGGFTHREGLSDEVLVKDNHWRVIEDLASLARDLASWRRQGLRVGIEVTSIMHFREAILLEPDYLLLDHFSGSALRKAVGERDRVTRATKRLVELEASGNVQLATVRAVAQTGVERISVGALTQSAPALDFSLELLS